MGWFEDSVLKSKQVATAISDQFPVGDFLSEKMDHLMTKTITIGVTGFSRSGKTVFIGSLAQALLTTDAWKRRRGQGPLAQFGLFERGAFRTAQIRDDIDSNFPQFPFLKVRSKLVGQNAQWPAPTEGISRLHLELEYHNKHFIKREHKLVIELVDYPGEWLIDLPMLDMSYANWSKQMLTQASKGRRKEWSHDYFTKLNAMTATEPCNEEKESQLSDVWIAYLQKAVDYGLVLNQPGRALQPGSLRHSPVLRLIPLPDSLHATDFGKKMSKRFDEYKEHVIKPFYNDYFKNIDRQIVMLDVLRALQQGEETFDELTDALKQMLQSFNYGKGSLLSWLAGVNITHVLFAATKADHVTRGDRANLEGMVRSMLMEVDAFHKIRSNVAHFDVMALASVRATEDRMTTHSPKREVLYGKPENEEKSNHWDPGGLPLDVPPQWESVYFQYYKFKPLPMRNALSEGFPAINLGKALDFLIGEDLK